MTPTCWSPSGTSPAFFEEVAEGRDAKAAANWVINELVGRLNKEGKDIRRFAGVGRAAWRDPRSDRDGNDFRQDRQGLVRDRLERGRRSDAIVETRGMTQVTDLSAIEKVVDEIIAENPDKVADAKSNPKAIGWFVGQVMKASGGKANPQAVNELLKRKLGV